MLATVFCGVSVDGFIARPDGGIDWLPQVTEEHGFTELMATVDAMVIGRATYETVLGLGGEWPYGRTPVIVLSTRALDLSAHRRYPVEQMGGEPAEIVARLEARGMKHIYVDGGITIQRFLRAGMIQRLIVTRVPVLIGQGIPLFGPLDADVPLRLVRTRDFPSGLVQTEYLIG
jgi:dihydrofolate reductase